MSDLTRPFSDPIQPSNGSNPSDHPTTAAKRQRRPSVRLGPVGDQPAASEPNLHRPKLVRLPSHKRPRNPNLKFQEDDVFEDFDLGDYEKDWNEGIVNQNWILTWLNGLGLGRYAPVFEIHEVDEDVLPFLTLDDLKDMGVNAVGARRKMFCAIQKLRKNKDK